MVGAGENEGRGWPKKDASMVGTGENEGRLESRSRRSASVHGAFLGAC